MTHRIYVVSTIADARAKVKKQQFDGILGKKNKLGAVYLADCYTIDAKLDKKQIEKTKTLLVNPLSQSASTHYPLITTHFFSGSFRKRCN